MGKVIVLLDPKLSSIQIFACGFVYSVIKHLCSSMFQALSWGRERRKHLLDSGAYLYMCFIDEKIKGQRGDVIGPKVYQNKDKS